MFNIRLLLSACIFFCATAFAADKAAVPPEKIVDLYLGAFVNLDPEQAAKANEILRPAYEGKDSLDVNKIKSMSDDLSARLAESTLQRMPAKAQAELKDPLLKMNKSIIAAMKKSQCKATGKEIRENKYVKGQKIATVSYTCKIVDTTKIFEPLKKRSVPKGETPSPALIADITNAFDNAPFGRSITRQMDVYGNSQGTWYSGSPAEPLGEVFGEIASPLEEILH